MAGYEFNTAATVVVFVFNATTGAGITGETSSTLTLYLREKGGSTVRNGTTTVTALDATNAPGYYEMVLAAGEINTQYTHFFPKSTTSGSGAVVIPPYFTEPAGSYNMSAVLPGVPTADTVGEAWKNASIGIPSSAPGASGGLAMYDDLFSVVAEGTIVTATSASNLTLDSNFVATADFYVGMFLVPQSGNAAKQPRAISTYSSGRVCTFTGTGSQISRPFTVAPSNGDPVKILGLSGTI